MLLSIIDAAYNRKSWHGRHNIWELVVHAAYWKYAAHDLYHAGQIQLLKRLFLERRDRA